MSSNDTILIEAGGDILVTNLPDEKLSVQSSDEVEIKLDVVGLQGIQGPPGPQGPPGSDNDDLPDFTLLFENALI